MTEIQAMKTNRNSQAGFSLVELMVVVTIIGILAGVAVPKFQTFRARASQTEAKSGLNGVYLTMQAYFANYGDYVGVAYADGNLILNTGLPGTAAPLVGFTLTGNRPKYRYALLAQAENPATGVPGAWAAYAYSNSSMGTAAGARVWDHQRINTNKWACSMYDGVAGIPGIPAPGIKVAANPRQCPEASTGAIGGITGAALRVADEPD